MPGSPRTRRPSAAGGTSVEAVETLASPEPFRGRGIVVGAVVVLAAIALIVLISRAGDDAPAATEPGTEQLGVAPSPVAPGPVEGERPPAPPSEGPPDPATTAAALERALAGSRLFGTVQVVEDIVEIRTEACADRAVNVLIAGYAADLRAGGVRSVRCVELHGAQVFAVPL